MDRDQVVALLAAYRELVARNEELSRQLEWFKRQIFGSKSERRVAEPDAQQPFLGESLQASAPDPDATITIAEHRRRHSTQDTDEETDEGGLRFDASVPVEEIRIPGKKPAEGEYEIVAEKTTYKLAQRPASYVILKYVREVIKRREDGVLSCPPAPPSVLGKSFADVSLPAQGSFSTSSDITCRSTASTSGCRPRGSGWPGRR